MSECREREGEEEKKTMSVIRGLPVYRKSKRTKECDHGLFLTQYNHISHICIETEHLFGGEESSKLIEYILFDFCIDDEEEVDNY